MAFELYVSKGNSKLKDIPSVNLEALKTCRADAPCRKGCYACKGHYNYKEVAERRRQNLAYYIAQPENYFNDMIKYFNGGLVIYKYARINDSGDIPDSGYLKGLIRVALACKRTTFLCYTKKFDIVNDYLNGGGVLPKNLVVVFSAWDKTFEVPNPYNLPVAYVNFKKAEKNPVIPLMAHPCKRDCSTCLTCWKLKKGESVVFNQH